MSEAKSLAKSTPSLTEVRIFLDGLPEGGRAWRLKWGNKANPGEGRGKKDRILLQFKTLGELRSANVELFIELFDDEVVGRSLYEFLHSTRGRDAIERLREVGVSFSSREQIRRND